MVPLLRITERSLEEESARLDTDAERVRDTTRATLVSLEDAYERDLQQVEQLTAEWVREATAVYVAAREVVLTHQTSYSESQQVRADNLRAAALATGRAIDLLEQRDGLLAGVTGDELQRLLQRLHKETNP